MKLFQSDIEKIQKITGKEYNVEYSNNADSEYVQIYDVGILEQIIEDLVEVLDGDNK